MTKISGGKAHRSTVRRLSRQSKAEVRKRLEVAAGMISTEAKLSITRGSISGKNHVPSAPGEPPNADTNTLDNSIDHVMISDTEAEVYADAAHAVPQEFGTEDGRLPERPYMRPAAAKEGPKAAILIREGINTIIRKGAA